MWSKDDLKALSADELLTCLIVAMVLVDSWKMYLLARNVWSVSRMTAIPVELRELMRPEDFQRVRLITYRHSTSEMLDTALSFVTRFLKLSWGYYPYVWAMSADYAESSTGRAVWFYILDVFLTRTAFIPLILLSSILSSNADADPFLLFINLTIQSALQAALAGLGALGLVFFTNYYGPKGFIVLTFSLNAFAFMLVSFYIRTVIPKTALPLEDDAVGNSVKRLANKVGYPANKIFIDPDMTSDPNAFYSCALGAKMILITQTLMSLLQPEQLTSVVAHELGHWHFYHPTLQYLMAVMDLAGLCFLWHISYGEDKINDMFGLEYDRPQSLIPVYLTIYYIFPVTQDVFSGLCSLIGRWCEFMADDYSSNQGYGASLREALLMLAARTKTYPLFDSWYSAWFLAHPTALERVRRIDRH